MKSAYSFHRVERFWKNLLFVFLVLASTARAALNVDLLQQSLSQGRTDDVLPEINAALQKDPDNPYLLYNRAVAFYAAKRFDEALIDLDLVENSSDQTLVNKARFQKGNAEFQLGLTKTNDVESIAAHWRQSLANYKAVLKEHPNHADARKNHEFVQATLLDLLLKMAQLNLNKGADGAQPPEQRIPLLRTAMEEFHEAVEIDPENKIAKEGEARARELLAELLAKEGTRKTLTTQLVAPSTNEPPVLRPDLAQIQEGVNMLEDAKDLKPGDSNIEQQLQQGRQRLADALTLQAEIYQHIEPQIPRFDEKQAILRMAMEALNRALEQVPDHQRAKDVLEQIKKRLAQVHEQQGDQLSQQSERSDLELKTQQLSEALDHFQQAADLQPQQSQLPVKAQQAQSKLEDALGKLADKLMKKPGEGEESMEGQASRLEGALQALNELQGLSPSEKTGQKAREVGGQLDALRMKMAASQKPGEQQGSGTSSSPESANAQNSETETTPVDTPPRFDSAITRGRYRSSALNRSLRDY